VTTGSKRIPSLIAAILRHREWVQDGRIEYENRVLAILEGNADAPQPIVDVLQEWAATYRKQEKEADAILRKAARKYPIIQEMSKVHGVAELLALKVAVHIDIERCQKISSLWRYAGYGVVEGSRERLKKGEKASFNRDLKTACWLVARSMIRLNSPYRAVYDEARRRYDETRPDWTNGHKHNAALGKMIKVWLSHVWLRWRELEGLPITNPYVHDIMGHASMYTPEEFGW
jgi:hypothetical protein